MFSISASSIRLRRIFAAIVAKKKKFGKTLIQPSHFTNLESDSKKPFPKSHTTESPLKLLS